MSSQDVHHPVGSEGPKTRRGSGLARQDETATTKIYQEVPSSALKRLNCVRARLFADNPDAPHLKSQRVFINWILTLAGEGRLDVTAVGG